MQQHLVADQKLSPQLLKALEQVDLERPTTFFYKNASYIKSCWDLCGLLFLLLIPTVIVGFSFSAFIFIYSFWVWLIIPVSIYILGACIEVWSYLARHRYLCIYPHELVFFDHTQIQRFPLERIAILTRGRIDQSVSSWSEALSHAKVSRDQINFCLDNGKGFNLDLSWTFQDENNEKTRLAFCDQIERDFVDRCMPILLAQYDHGDLLHFPRFIAFNGYRSGKYHGEQPEGGLSISRTSVSNSKETLLWDEIEIFQIDREAIRIRKRGKVLDWYCCPLPYLSNACLLRQLAQQRELLK
jgi:hypothetical protein